MSEGSLFFLDVDEIVDVEKFRTIKRKKIQQGISPALVAKERNSLKEGYVHIGRSREMFLHEALVEKPDVKILEPKRLEVDGGIEKFTKKRNESYEDSGHVTYAYGIFVAKLIRIIFSYISATLLNLWTKSCCSWNCRQ